MNGWQPADYGPRKTLSADRAESAQSFSASVAEPRRVASCMNDEMRGLVHLLLCCFADVDNFAVRTLPHILTH
jgi:hypothetical protein